MKQDAVRQKPMVARISEVKMRIRREQLNLARQPILHEPLEQDRLVHPRLVARETAPAGGKGSEKP